MSTLDAQNNLPANLQGLQEEGLQEGGSHASALQSFDDSFQQDVATTNATHREAAVVQTLERDAQPQDSDNEVHGNAQYAKAQPIVQTEQYSTKIPSSFSRERAVLINSTRRSKRWLYAVVAVVTIAWFVLLSFVGTRGFLPTGFAAGATTKFDLLVGLSLAFLPLVILALAFAVALRQLQAREQSGLFALQLDLLTGERSGVAFAAEEQCRLDTIGAEMLRQAEALREASGRAGELLQSASAGVCEKTATMKLLAEETKTEAYEMMEVVSALLRERLSAMGDMTNSSLKSMTEIVDRLQNKEEALSAITREFEGLKGDMGGLLAERSDEFVGALQGELSKMTTSFDVFREEITRKQQSNLEQLRDSGDDVTAHLQQIAEANSMRLQDFEKNIESQHTQMVENFSTGQNSLYTRVRGVLHDITTGVDQLVNRIESRQVQIRETLTEQTSKLQGILSSFNAQHEAEVRQSAQTLIDAGEHVKKRMFEQNTELRALFVRTLESQKDLRKAVTERLEQDRELLEGVVVEQNDILHAKLRGNFSHHSEWLSHLVSWLEQQNESLHARAQDYESVFEGLLTRTLGALDRSGEAITHRLHELKDHSDKTGSSMASLSGTISSALASIEEHSRRGLLVAGELSDKIAEGAQTLDQTTDALIASGRSLSDNLREQADKIGEATAYIRSEQDQVIDGIAEKAIARIESFSTNVQEQTQLINDALTKRLAEQGDILHQSMAHNVRQFDRLGENLSHALVETNNKIFERLLEQTGLLDKSASKLVSQIAQSTQALDNSLDQMQGAIQGNDSRIVDIKTLARKQLQYFESLLERIEGSSALVRTRLLEDQRKIFSALDGVQIKNVEASSAVAETGANAIERAEKAGTMLAVVQERLQQHLAAMSEVSNQARMHVSALEEKIRAQIAHIGQALEGHNKTLTVAFDPTLRQVGRIVEAMDQQAERLYKGFEDSHSRVHKTSALLQQQELQIRTLFTAASETMGKAEERLLGSAQTIARSATNLEQQSQKIAQLLYRQTQVVEKSASGFEERLKDMGSALLTNLEELRTSGEQFALRFRNTGSDFRSISEDLQNVLQRTVSSLDSSSSRFADSSRRLVSGLEHTDRLLQEQRASSEASTRSFSAFGKRAGEALSAVQERFKETELAFDKVAVSITDNIRTLSQAVSDDKRGAAAITQQLGSLRGDLYRQCREIESLTNKALDRFESLPADLQRHGNKILARVDSLRSETESLSQKITDDVRKLKRATDPIRENMRNLFSGGLSDPQEAFMKRARVIVEDLHKHSSNIVHQIFDDDDSISLANFENGESNAFTKWILQSTSPALLAKMNGAVEAEASVSKSVIAYQRVFEDLFNGAQDVDPDNLLSMAFMSSDVGKLYLVFARVCGREPIGFESMH